VSNFGGQVARVTAKVLGIPRQTPENWVRLEGQGKLRGAGDKPVSAEPMELARLRAENVRLRMERDILGKAMAYFARVSK
jgi:transposase